MKILINASNLVIGGGIQVGVWFIRQCLLHRLDCYFAVSPIILKELKSLNVSIDDKRFKTLITSPARNAISRQELVQFANSSNVNVVYTIFGPSYVKFEQPHLLGFAAGWLSHASFTDYKRSFLSSFKVGLRTLLQSIYKAYWVRFADAWVFETQIAANGLAKRISLDSNKCHVVGNNCSDVFNSRECSSPQSKEPFYLLYLTADYVHKGIINYLSYAKALNELDPDKKFVFKISISKTSGTALKIMKCAKESGLGDYFDFCGYVSTEKAVSLMDSSHVIMQTSYLETFSANYPEAMARKRPLIVSDFSFARDICKDAALYVNPDDAYEVAKTILKLRDDDTLQKQLVNNGVKRHSEFPTSDQRFNEYINLIELVYQKGTSKY